jgi:large subunit ribosomal protein L21
MDFAIIKTGGKQYKVQEGSILNIEKINKEEGEEVVFDEVLLKSFDDDCEIGTPLLEGSKVIGKVLEQGRDDKVTVFKYKPKKRYKKKMGHRQPFTKIKIEKIN